MTRHLLKDLEEWKKSLNRKPLILHGARQVGKTWLLTEFGKRNFDKVVYLNFESSERLKNLFIADFDIARIISVIEIEKSVKITPEDTLLIFDEIQEAEKGITSLKYFCENAPQYYVVAAGSLLGVSIQKQNSFPVGKVDFLRLYPLSFAEFLENSGEQALMQALQNKQWEVVASFHEKLVGLLRQYYFTGGMPEVVRRYFAITNDPRKLEEVRELQKIILMGYENDFGKYAPIELVPRIKMVWNSLLYQLAKTNQKFIPGQVKKGARHADFEAAINWLCDAGLVLKIKKIEKPTPPIKSYADETSFKLFFLDIGLLNALGDVPASLLLEPNKTLVEYKGAITEQYVCQQLALTKDLYYWALGNSAEIDFIWQQQDSQVTALEVKSEENTVSKSMKIFIEKYETPKALLTSMLPYQKGETVTKIPLYGVGFIPED